MQKRNLAIMVVLFIVTFGIYGIVWYCSFQNQLKKTTGMGYGGFGHLMATIFTFGIYGIVWSYNAGERIQKLGGKNNGLIYLILTLVGFSGIAYLLMQNEVNQL